MGQKPYIIAEAGLQFFGKISASISHEIKNVLAIINENAGLLDDFTLMATKGMAINPDRLKTMAVKVMEQIGRADGIIKNMNKFAHSADDPIKGINLADTLELIRSLSGRFASMRGITLAPVHHANPTAVTTMPFFLENIIWLCLDFAMDTAGAGKTVGLACEETKDGARIKFSRLEALGEKTVDMFPTETEKALLDVLKAEVLIDLEAGEIILNLPKNIEA